MATIEIRKGVPLPRPRGGIDYPFANMEIGDSFIFPAGVTRSTANGLAFRARRRLGRRFVTRTLPDGSLGCWRIEAPEPKPEPNGALRSQLAASLAATAGEGR